VGGYGDAPFAAWTTPELSTIQIPWEDTGTRSAVTLTKRIATPGTSIVHRTMDARLLIRKSS
jgi:DNA-binding LacI/PurR family transcriptional regulator